MNDTYCEILGRIYGEKFFNAMLKESLRIAYENYDITSISFYKKEIKKSNARLNKLNKEKASCLKMPKPV